MAGTSLLDTSGSSAMKGFAGPFTALTPGLRLQSKTWKRRPKSAEEVSVSVPVAV